MNGWDAFLIMLSWAFFVMAVVGLLIVILAFIYYAFLGFSKLINRQKK